MSDTNKHINKAYGLVEDTLRLTSGRDLFSAAFTADLMLDLRSHIAGAAEDLGITIKPDMPYASKPKDDDDDGGASVPAVQPDEPDGPSPVAVSPPTTGVA